MSVENPRRIVLAVTGASGALYAMRTLSALLQHGQHVDLIVTDYGRRLLTDELGPQARVDRLQAYLEETWGEGVRRGGWVLHSNKDLGSRIASGSKGADAMVIAPCSMKTMAAIAHGLSRSLVERAADVMLKERRPLLIMPRETPMSLPQLKNMVLCAEAGAVVVPAMPGFYQRPQTDCGPGRFHGRTDPVAAAHRAPAVSRMGSAGGTGMTRRGPRRPDVRRPLARHRQGSREDRGDVRCHRWPLRPAEPRAQRRPGCVLAVARGASPAVDRHRARPRPLHRHLRRRPDDGPAAARQTRAGHRFLGRDAQGGAAEAACRGPRWRDSAGPWRRHAAARGFRIDGRRDDRVRHSQCPGRLRRARGSGTGAQARRAAGHPGVLDPAAARWSGRRTSGISATSCRGSAASCPGTARPTRTFLPRSRASRRRRSSWPSSKQPG